MLDIETEDQLVSKVGGKIRLTALMQKRMIELKRGARALVPRDKGMTLMQVIVKEILEDRIDLSPRSEVDTTFLDGGRRSRSTDDEGDRQIYGSDLKRIKEQRIKELSALLNPTKK